eukprot:jgi/Psemu1/14227/gm1.14227_g
MNPKVISPSSQTAFFLLVLLMAIASTTASPSSLRGGVPTYDSTSSSSIESGLNDIFESAMSSFRNLLNACGEHNIFVKHGAPPVPSISSLQYCESAEFYPLKCKKRNNDGIMVTKIYNNDCLAEAEGWVVDDECYFIQKCANKPMTPFLCNGHAPTDQAVDFSKRSEGDGLKNMEVGFAHCGNPETKIVRSQPQAGFIHYDLMPILQGKGLNPQRSPVPPSLDFLEVGGTHIVQNDQNNNVCMAVTCPASAPPFQYDWGLLQYMKCKVLHQDLVVLAPVQAHVTPETRAQTKAITALTSNQLEANKTYAARDLYLKKVLLICTKVIPEYFFPIYLEQAKKKKNGKVHLLFQSQVEKAAEEQLGVLSSFVPTAALKKFQVFNVFEADPYNRGSLEALKWPNEETHTITTT